MNQFLKTETILRIGVAFSFIYPAVSAWFSPYAWVGYFPSFLSNGFFIDEIVLLHTFGLLEIVIALWILFGKKIFIPSFIAVVMLFLIIIFNLNQMDVLFRDIPILLMALILVLKYRTKS